MKRADNFEMTGRADFHYQNWIINVHATISSDEGSPKCKAVSLPFDLLELGKCRPSERLGCNSALGKKENPC